MNQKKTQLISAVVLALVMAGCGPKKPMITQQQITDARNNGNLEQLYTKVQQDLATASGSQKKSLQTISAQIAEQLAVDTQQKIYQTIEDKRLPSGAVSLSLIEQLKAEANPLRSWNPQRHADTLQKLSMEATQAQDALSRQLVAVSKIPVDDEIRRINAMGVAADIAGPGSQHYQQYERQKEQTLVGWMVEADTAISNRHYTHAATFLRKVLGIDPSNQEAKEKLAIAEQQGFETTFRKALEDSKPELAYSELLRISESPMFDTVKGTLASSIKLLNDFFVNRGLQSSSQGALKGAYKQFMKARKIRAIMGQPLPTDAEFDFLKKLVNFAASLERQKRYGEQLAYLEIVNEFNPQYPGIKNALQDARKQIIEYASTSMLVEDFAQTGTHHSAGKSVAQKVYGWTFENMPGEIALVSKQQLASADKSAPGRLLILEGAILQAGVDNENTTGQKTMRVVTESKKTPNPEYAKWVKRGSNGTAPQEFFVEEKKEDVTVNVTYARKTGILSVSYRLIDQKTGQVLINENARDKKVIEGEGNEGVSIGEFNLPFKRPELASDIEIMENLSTAVAQQIGAKLKELLQNPDDRYESMGESALSNGQYASAKSYLGYATAIRSAKTNEYQSVRDKLIDTVMNH